MYMQRKILIIEDEFDLSLLLKLHLMNKEYDVAMAYNIKDGMNKIESFQPDILFLDNNLPDGYGWEKVIEIKEQHPSIKINLMTGFRREYSSLADIKNLCIMEKPLSKKEIDDCLALT